VGCFLLLDPLISFPVKSSGLHFTLAFLENISSIAAPSTATRVLEEVLPSVKLLGLLTSENFIELIFRYDSQS